MIRDRLKKNRFLHHVYSVLAGRTALFIDYPFSPRERWGSGNPNPHLLALIDARRDAYREFLQGLLAHKDLFAGIPARNTTPEGPRWDNGWLPALDAMALVGQMADARPSLYLEVGSGHSTRFAHHARKALGLSTRIVSIDPHPRVGIDALCDELVRKPLEDADLSVFGRLEAGDILFFDGSHRSFMNTDVTVFFLEILPLLKPGVRVQIHDMFLPYDYPQNWSGRHYNEEYLLAALLLGGGGGYVTALPNAFVHRDPELSAVLDPVWKAVGPEFKARTPGSYWLVRK